MNTNDMPPSELLAHRLAAVPTIQLEALHEAILGSMAYAQALMTWLRELVVWEMRRRRAEPGPNAVPVAQALDLEIAALTLASFSAIFRTSIAQGAVELRPTVELLDAAREALIGYASGRAAALH